MLIVPYFPESQIAAITIDGIDYRVPLLDSASRLLVALDVGGIVPATTVANGHKTVTAAGSAEQMASVACKGVSLKALSTNTGIVYVGDSAVSSANGRELQKGEVLDLVIDNLNRLYLDVSVSGEGVSYLAVS